MSSEQQQQQQQLVPLADFLSAKLADCGCANTPGRAFLLGCATALLGSAAASALREGGVVKRLKLAVFKAGRSVLQSGVLAPVGFGADHIDKEIAKNVKDMNFRTLKEHAINNALPEKGLTFADVMKEARALREKLDEDFVEGHLSGTVYHGGKDLTQLINDILVLYQWTNPLHMDTFGSVRQMEAEIVQMCVSIFNGGDAHPESKAPGACGGVTSGGTDSICMAMKAYREQHKEKRGITKPNMVVPVTAHPAFDKACHYYGIEKKEVPVNAATGVVDPDVLEQYITDDTIVIVGSAVNYPYGTADDIVRLGQIALKYGVGMHVDCCLGGFVLQFLEDAGVANVPRVDFRVPGVQSVSVDTHKFGFAPKGSSVVLFSTKELRHHMYFAISTWPGGIYASPGYNGSRPGNILAGTWAAMMAMGKDGYVKSARDVYDTMQKLVRGVREIPHLYVVGAPQTSAVAFAARDLDVYEIKKRVTERFGWQLHTLQFPPAIQFSLTWVHSAEGVIDKMVADIKVVVEELYEEVQAKKKRGEKVVTESSDSPNMYGTQQRIPDRSIIDQMAKAYIDKYYQTVV